MARNDKAQTAEKTPATEAPVVETPAVETPAEATGATTEATGATTEAPAAEAPAEPDLTAFNEAIKGAIESRDDSGNVNDAAAEKAVEAYRALDAKGKRLAKKALQDGLRESVNGNDMSAARAYMGLNDKMVDGAATKATREPVDPTQAFVERAVALKLGAAEFTHTVPEGVKEDWRDQANKLTESVKAQVEAYRTYLAEVAAAAEGVEVKEPEGIHDVVKAAFKIAAGKGVGGLKRVGKSGGARVVHDGPRRDIAKHITAAFSDLSAGDFLTVAEIRAKKSEEYGDEQPSSGAISARLFPQSGKVTVEGVRPGEKDGKKGAFKL